ncbi:putative quinol monooxygenase [Vulcanococcus limneticus]|uniref:putative quinol monooxygenase n=1 Tax=Vulcanococcus limneticus TaxID=2170428 RepID=UPI00398C200D
MKRLDGCISVYPAFQIKPGREQDIRALLRVIIERAESEPGTEIFSMAYMGDKLFLRESYTDIEGFKAHLQSVDDIIGDFFSMLTLESLYVIAPASAIDEMKALMNSMNMQAGLYALEGGFAR